MGQIYKVQGQQLIDIADEIRVKFFGSPGMTTNKYELEDIPSLLGQSRVLTWFWGGSAGNTTFPSYRLDPNRNYLFILVDVDGDEYPAYSVYLNYGSSTVLALTDGLAIVKGNNSSTQITAAKEFDPSTTAPTGKSFYSIQLDVYLLPDFN